MTLTTKIPTEEGYYWFQDSFCEEPEIVRVQKHQDSFWISNEDISFFLEWHKPLDDMSLNYFSEKIEEPVAIVFSGREDEDPEAF